MRPKANSCNEPFATVQNEMETMKGFVFSIEHQQHAIVKKSSLLPCVRTCDFCLKDQQIMKTPTNVCVAACKSRKSRKTMFFYRNKEMCWSSKKKAKENRLWKQLS